MREGRGGHILGPRGEGERLLYGVRVRTTDRSVGDRLGHMDCSPFWSQHGLETHNASTNTLATSCDSSLTLMVFM